jgi:peptide/nickel transport system permease protein
MVTEGRQEALSGAEPAIQLGRGPLTVVSSMSTLRRFVRRQPVGLFGLLVLLAMAFIAVFAPLLVRSAPDAFHGDAILAPPSVAHPFGTDALGQDLLSRIFYGARVALGVSGGAVLGGLLLGTVLGLIAGYWSNLVSAAVQRIVDGMMAFPTLILALIVVAIFGQGLTVTAVAIAVSLVPSTTRVVRSAVLATKVEPYLDASRVVGASDLRLIYRHVLPNVVPTIIVAASVGLGGAILAEAALSFLGLGSPPTNPSWGQLLSSESRKYMQTAPWLAIFPGLFLSLTVLAVNLFGDALRDVLDPRMRGA